MVVRRQYILDIIVSASYKPLPVNYETVRTSYKPVCVNYRLYVLVIRLYVAENYTWVNQTTFPHQFHDHQ